MHTRITKTDKANGIPICDINIKCILLTIIITSNNTKCKQYLSLFYKIVSSQTVTYLLTAAWSQGREGREGGPYGKSESPMMEIHRLSGKVAD